MFLSLLVCCQDWCLQLRVFAFSSCTSFHKHLFPHQILYFFFNFKLGYSTDFFAISAVICLASWIFMDKLLLGWKQSKRTKGEWIEKKSNQSDSEKNVEETNLIYHFWQHRWISFVNLFRFYFEFSNKQVSLPLSLSLFPCIICADSNDISLSKILAADNQRHHFW